MKKIEIAVSDAFAAELELLCENVRKSQREAKDSYGSDEFVVLSSDEVAAHALRLGVSRMTSARSPNSVLALNAPGNRTYKKGDVLSATVSLPIGSEVLAMVASPEDGPHWDVANLIFGAMNIVNPYGTGPVSLTSLQHMTSTDVLSVLDGMRTIVDVQVNVQLIAKRDDVTFDGYRIYLWNEEQVLGIKRRIEPAEESLIGMEKCRREFDAAVGGLIPFKHRLSFLGASGSHAESLMKKLDNLFSQTSRVHSFELVLTKPEVRTTTGAVVPSVDFVVSARLLASDWTGYIELRNKLVSALYTIAGQTSPTTILHIPTL